jgi:gamma-aminobutyric acid type B receptor
MHYKMSDALINKLSVEDFKSNPAYYPPPAAFCPNGTLGCENHCSKSEACTLREGSGQDCLVMSMMFPNYDRAYFQAVVSNIGIPAYFCFIEYDGVNAYASEAAEKGKPVIFIHWEPDMFHVTHKGLFDRVFLPRADPERVLLATGDYGENSYGGKTKNGVDVDYPSQQIAKYAASIVKALPAGALFSKLAVTNTDINNMLSAYVTASSDSSEPSPYFRAACNWVKDNYDT